MTDSTPSPFMQRMLRRGGVVRRINHDEAPDAASDGRHPGSLRNLGHKRPGSAPTPEDYLPDDGSELGAVSGLDQLGTGSYSGPAMMISSYTSEGVLEKRNPPSTTDSWANGYAADDPTVLRKLFGVMVDD